jgi:5-methylcytosine-specific restriction endonuclease McrA
MSIHLQMNKKVMYYRHTNPFYLSKEWQHLRREVLKSDRYECQHCKAHGYYAPATTVHHIKHLLEFPELALCKYYKDKYGVEHRNLISLCEKCHKAEHGEKVYDKKCLNEEKW